MGLSRKDCLAIRSALEGKGTNLTYSEVARWLRRAGFEGPSKAGSHRVFVYRPSGKRVGLVEKGHGDLLPVYVKSAARAILEIGGCPSEPRERGKPDEEALDPGRADQG